MERLSVNCAIFQTSRVVLKLIDASFAPVLGVSATHAAFPSRRYRQHSSLGPETLLPAQRCLELHGITKALLGDVYWDSPILAQYSQERAQNELEPMLAALGSEGVVEQSLARLLRQTGLLSCSTADFLNNLYQLNELLHHIERPRLEATGGWAAGISPTGLLVARAPACLATYLSRPPGSLAANAAWLRNHYSVDAPTLARMVFRRPCVLTVTVGPELDQILGILDSLKGLPGWGRQLMASDPLVVTYTLATVLANVEPCRRLGSPGRPSVLSWQRSPTCLCCPSPARCTAPGSPGSARPAAGDCPTSCGSPST